MKKVVIATTGLSSLLLRIIENQLFWIVAIVDFQYSNSSCKRFSQDHNIIYHSYRNFEIFEIWLKKLQPDLMVVYKMPFLLPENIFSIPLYGTINMHPSLLPQYKGPNPWFWIYYHMERISGVTIHRIDKQEDHGEILAQGTFDIELGTDLQALRLKSEQVGSELLTKVILNIDTIKGWKQKIEPFIFRAANVLNYSSIIDFKEMEGLRIWHLLRGFPWLLPMITDCTNKDCKIQCFTKKAEVDQENIGKIISDHGEYFLYCKDGAISILDIVR